MKNWLMLMLSIIVLGGCATYTYNNYEGYKAGANTEFRVLNYDTFGDSSNFSGYSETSQEEANQNALRACTSSSKTFSTSVCLIEWEGFMRVWEESLEKHRQQVNEEALLSSVKRCITYGFEGRVEIATCVQKEMNPSVTVVTGSTNNQEIASRLQSLEIQNAITQGMLWYQRLQPKN